jgi:hypothetical protein
MSHWAEIDENNIVKQVLIGNNAELDEGYQWLLDNLGGRWIKTSYNTVGGEHANGGTPLRKNFAGIGFTYDEVRDAFIAPQNFPSWVLDEETCTWKPPVDMPESPNGEMWCWNEDSQDWFDYLNPDNA